LCQTLVRAHIVEEGGVLTQHTLEMENAQNDHVIQAIERRGVPQLLKRKNSRFSSRPALIVAWDRDRVDAGRRSSLRARHELDVLLGGRGRAQYLWITPKGNRWCCCHR